MVEFAIVLPIFLFVIFAMVNYAAMLSFRQTLSQAAAEGARAAAVAPFNTSTAQRYVRAKAAVNEAFQGQNASCGDGWLTCTPQPSASCTAGAECISVTLTYAYNSAVNARRIGPPVPRVFGFSLPAQISYTASARVH
jgi:Flp pilus assembly protein TadG